MRDRSFIIAAIGVVVGLAVYIVWGLISWLLSL
jgi:hypothetical protein